MCPSMNLNTLLWSLSKITSVQCIRSDHLALEYTAKRMAPTKILSHVSPVNNRKCNALSSSTLRGAACATTPGTSAVVAPMHLRLCATCPSWSIDKTCLQKLKASRQPFKREGGAPMFLSSVKNLYTAGSSGGKLPIPNALHIFSTDLTRFNSVAGARPLKTSASNVSFPSSVGSPSNWVLMTVFA